MDMKPYFVDDSFPNLSRFYGMSEEELEREAQEKKAKNKEFVIAV